VDKGWRTVARGPSRRGAPQVSCTRVGKDTALAQIIRLVQEAQGARRYPGSGRSCRSVFVPAVIGMALITFILWWSVGGDFVPAMIRLVAVLIIACPCASGWHAHAIMADRQRRGEGDPLQEHPGLQLATRLDIIVLDKTGT